MPAKNNIPTTTLAYIAGFFDGDGHVTMHARLRGSYTIAVGIAQVHREPLERVTEDTGLGRTYLEPRGTKHPIYRWRTPPRDTFEFIGLVLPYLKSKRIQAALLAEYTIRVQRIPVTPEGVQERRDLAAEYAATIYALNQKADYAQVFQGNSTEENWAYIAGLFDAEGCISISGAGTGYKKTPETYRPRASLGMTDFSTMEWVVSIVSAGTIKTSHPPSAQAKGQKPMAVWTVPAGALVPFLSQISPHLRVKQKQCDLAIRLADCPVSKRGAIAEEIRALNQNICLTS